MSCFAVFVSVLGKHNALDNHPVMDINTQLRRTTAEPSDRNEASRRLSLSSPVLTHPPMPATPEARQPSTRHEPAAVTVAAATTEPATPVATQQPVQRFEAATEVTVRTDVTTTVGFSCGFNCGAQPFATQEMRLGHEVVFHLQAESLALSLHEFRRALAFEDR